MVEALTTLLPGQGAEKILQDDAQARSAGFGSYRTAPEIQSHPSSLQRPAFLEKEIERLQLELAAEKERNAPLIDQEAERSRYLAGPVPAGPRELAPPRPVERSSENTIGESGNKLFLYPEKYALY